MKVKRICVVLVLMLFCVSALPFTSVVNAKMPFYNLNPKNLVLRSEFTTFYRNSTDERKSNIKLASKSINKYFLDVGAEFSFNRVVGKRTEKRGYKPAKIISMGKFVEGVGGGVCQVSTTLYNAALLADLEILEWHRHSLAVSYVKPSFDAMVNSNVCDLRFRNNTDNPIIITACADDEKIKIMIYGEKLEYSIERESQIVMEIPAPSEEIKVDELNEYPELYEGERKVVSYSKNGLVSCGSIIKRKNGKVIKREKIRGDKYKPYQGLIVVGKAKRIEQDLEEDTTEN